VRSHYPDADLDREKWPDRMYRAGNALGDWLGLNGWAGIAIMQSPENIAEFRTMIRSAK
jgi:hypothetical protein